MPGLKKLGAAINEAREPSIEIAAGLVYLAAFNTFLPNVDAWYFGFIVLVAALCAPPLFGTPTAPWNTRRARISKVRSVSDSGRQRLLSAGSSVGANDLRRKSQMPEQSWTERLFHELGDAVADVREKVVEEGWFGRVATERGEGLEWPQAQEAHRMEPQRHER